MSYSITKEIQKLRSNEICKMVTRPIFSNVPKYDLNIVIDNFVKKCLIIKSRKFIFKQK